jgi:hypothetical protein
MRRRWREHAEQDDWAHLRGRFKDIEAHDDPARPDVIPGPAPEPGHQTHTWLRETPGGYHDGSDT